MNPQQMRDAIADKYKGLPMEKRIYKMRDDQVVAIFHRMFNKQNHKK